MEAFPLPEDVLSRARLGEIMNLLLLEYLLGARGLCVSSYPHNSLGSAPMLLVWGQTLAFRITWLQAIGCDSHTGQADLSPCALS